MSCRPSIYECSAGEEGFSREEIECLEEESIFQPQQGTSRKHRVMTVCLPPPPSSPSSSVSATVQFRNFTSKPQNFIIPDKEDSAETLELIGFTKFTAKEIFERYRGRPDPDQCPDNLMDYVYAHICQLHRYDHMQDKEAMTAIGLNAETQDSLTDPNFSDIFGTADLHYWVKDTLQIRYASLLARRKKVKDYAAELIADKKKPEVWYEY